MNTQQLRADLASRITTRQGNARLPGGGIYGFTGEDAQLGRKFYTGRAYSRYGLPDTPLGNYASRVANHTPEEHQRAVEAYRPQFEKALQDPNSEVARSIEKLSDRLVRGEQFVLTCWCPENLPCHTRDVVQPAVIDRALEKAIQQFQSIEESKEVMEPDKTIYISAQVVRSEGQDEALGIVVEDAQGNELLCGVQHLGRSSQQTAFFVQDALSDALNRADDLGAEAVVVRTDQHVAQMVQDGLPGDFQGLKQVEFQTVGEVQPSWQQCALLAQGELQRFEQASNLGRAAMPELDWAPTPAGLQLLCQNHPEMAAITADSSIPAIAALAPDAEFPLWVQGQWHDSVADAYNACKEQCQDNAARVELMYDIVRANLKQHPGMLYSIEERGGADWLQMCRVEVGPDLAAGWGGENLDSSPFLQCLVDAYQDVREAQPNREETMQMFILGSDLDAFPFKETRSNAQRYLEYVIPAAVSAAEAQDKTCLRVVVGAEPGVDFWAAEKAIAIRDNLEFGAMEDSIGGEGKPNPLRIEVVIAVPCLSLEDQMTPVQREQYARLLDGADRVELAHPPGTTALEVQINRQIPIYQLDPKQDFVAAVKCSGDREVQERLETAKQRGLKVVVYDPQRNQQRTIAAGQESPSKAVFVKRKAVEAER